MSRYIGVFTVAAFAVVIVGVTSTSGAQGPPEGFALPPQAAEVAPGVFFLGTGVDNGVPVVGYAYAHHRDGHGGGKPTSPPTEATPTPTPDPDPDASSCYSFIANGASWPSAEDVLVNPASNLGVTVNDIEGWMTTWEDELAPSSSLYGNFLGTSDTLTADSGGTDGRNEVYFASIAESGVLGYTIVWSTRKGPPRSRGIVEADMVIDTDAEWDWWTGGNSIGGTQQDLGAVFTHEAGHYVGLGHTEDSELCESQTMYPYLTGGDDTKQSLGDGDKAGIHALY